MPRYLELLGAGGSRSPEELAAIAGLDLEDPSFWAQGLELVRDQLEQAEAAAAEVRAGGLSLSRARAALEEVAHRGDVGLVLLDEGHVAAVLEDDELGVGQAGRDRLGRRHRAGAVVAPGEHEHRVGDLGEAVLDGDRAVVLVAAARSTSGP